jgi:hypothetical protein
MHEDDEQEGVDADTWILWMGWITVASTDRTDRVWNCMDI